MSGEEHMKRGLGARIKRIFRREKHSSHTNQHDVQSGGAAAYQPRNVGEPTADREVLQGTAGDSKAPSDDKYSPPAVPVTSPGQSTTPQQGGSAKTPAKEALAAENVKDDRGGDLAAAEGRKEQAETLREGAAAERRRAGSANAVVQRSPEQLSPVAPDKLTVDEETGFRNVTVSPPPDDTSGLEERSAASRAVEGVEAALEGLEPGRDQLGKVVQETEGQGKTKYDGAEDKMPSNQDRLEPLLPPKPSHEQEVLYEGAGIEQRDRAPSISAQTAYPASSGAEGVTYRIPQPTPLGQDVAYEAGGSGTPNVPAGAVQRTDDVELSESRNRGAPESGAHHKKPDESTDGAGDSARDSGQGVLGAVKSFFQSKLAGAEGESNKEADAVAEGGADEVTDDAVPAPDAAPVPLAGRVIDSAVNPLDVRPSPFAGLASKSPFPAGQHCCDMPPSETPAGVMKAGDSKHDKADRGVGSQYEEAPSEPRSGKAGVSERAPGARGEVSAAQKSAAPVLPVSDAPYGGPSSSEEFPRPVSDVQPGPAGAVAKVEYESRPGIMELARDVLSELYVLLLAVLEGFWPWLTGDEPHILEPLNRLREARFGSS